MTMMRTYHLFFLIALISCWLSCESKKTALYEVIIQGGLLNVGEGNESYSADIGINADTIAYIGKIEGDATKHKIDARGLVVVPGFIDMHLHLASIFEYPGTRNVLAQGVTMGLGGPDGRGFWPVKPYLDSLDLQNLGINVAYLVGHNKIRETVMGMEDRQPTNDELNRMKNMVDQAMQEGAFGISTGLKYLPGAFSEVEEVIELSRVVASHGGIYTSHLREEGLGLIEGVQEAIQIGQAAEIPIVLTHHKVIGQPMWGSSVQTLAMVDSARALGIDVMLDQYPYTASFTDLSILIPAWSMAGGPQAFVERTRNAVLRDSILAGIEYNIIHDRGGGDLDRVQLASTPWDHSLAGKTLKFWAEREDLEPTARNGAMLVLQAQLEGGGKAIYHAMDEDDLQRIMKHPQTMIGSDGFLTEPGNSWAHPRFYGTYPRVLGHYVRDLRVIDLPTAIQKMTSLPADRLGLKKRGRLKVGNFADITIFDPATILDQATFLHPHQYPRGIEYVLVNGVVALQNGEYTGDRGGRVLRRTTNSR